MPEKRTLERAREDAREGKSPSTQAGEFVREEIHHIREGKHGASSPKQAIAIGLSKARRAGVKLGAPKGPATLREKAERDEKASERPHRKVSRRRSRAVEGALKREPRTSASHKSLSRQATSAARKRGRRSRSEAAKKAARTRKARSS
jgi:Family of unknown function (DUF6496)